MKEESLVMNEGKIKLLMELFQVNNLDDLRSICPVNMDNWFYKQMEDNEFIEMVKIIYKINLWGDNNVEE
jgi:hypothetical protein